MLKSGNICVRLAETWVISSCARSTVTPGFNRPTTMSDRPRGVRACAVKPIGSHTSTLLSRNEKPGGMTPTTVYGVPCDTIGLSRIAGSAPKRRFHSRSLMTTDRLPGTFSAAVNPRPRVGCTPRIWKSSAEMDCACTSSGSPLPVTVTL